MNSSSSSNISALKKHIDALSEFNFDSSQNVSDLLGNISIFSNPSSPNFSTPTASSPLEDGDEHLLDFLDNSQSVDLSNNKDISLEHHDLNDIEITPPKISNLKHRQKLRNAKPNSEISAFLNTFNNKFKVVATNLSDVIELVDSMRISADNSQISSNNSNNKRGSLDSNKNHKEPSNNQQQNPQIYYGTQTGQMRIAELQIERDSLNRNLLDSQSQISSLQNQISNLKSSNTAIIESNKALQRDISNLQNSMSALHEIVEQQLLDITNLSEQRSKLIDITKSQEAIIQIYDTLCKTSMKEQQIQQQQKFQQKKLSIPNESNQPKGNNNSKNQHENEITDELYSIMCSIVHLTDDSLIDKTINTKIYSIRDNSEIPLRERLMLIIKYMISSFSSANEKMNENGALIQGLQEKVTKYHRKCIDILSIFEEELNFLQSLTHCPDLQAAIFQCNVSNKKYKKQPMIINDDCKTELIRHCAVLGSYVEETIGFISSDNISFEGAENISFDSTNIFQFLQKSSLEEKMANVLNRFTDEDSSNCVENRQMFDILAAQIYINDILKNYASELQYNISQNGREISLLRQELEKCTAKRNTESRYENDCSLDEKEQSHTLKKLVKRYQRRENKLKKYISNFVEVNDEIDIINAVTSVISQMNEQLRQQQQQSSISTSSYNNQNLSNDDGKLKEEVEKCQQIIKDLEKKLKNEQAKNPGANKTGIQYEEINKELQKQLDDYKGKFEEIQKQSQTCQNEIQSLKNSIETKEMKIKEMNQENLTNQSKYETALNDAQLKLDSSINTIKSLTKEMRQYEIVLDRAKKQRPKLMKEIERLQNTNKKLSETILMQNNQIKNDFEIKIIKFTEENERYRQEKEAKQAELDAMVSKNQQLSTEISTLLIEKKSADLKLQAFDKRSELEKQNILTQFSAKNNANQIELIQQINNLNTQIDEAVNRLSSLIISSENNETINGKESGSNVLSNTVSSIEKELMKYRNVQHLYIDLLDDVTAYQKLLKLNSSSKISLAIKELLTLQDSQQNMSLDNQKRQKQDKQEIEKLRKAISKYESQNASLKHWENWARRIYRVIHEIDFNSSQQMNNDNLRLNLEEALLASVSHKSTMLRLESLRIQKSIFLKYDQRTLFQRSPPSASSTINIKISSLHSIIAVLIFVRRSQVQAGCLPLTIPIPDFQRIPAKLPNSTSSSSRASAKNNASPVMPKLKIKSKMRLHSNAENESDNNKNDFPPKSYKKSHKK